MAGDESWSGIADFVESRLRKRTVVKKGSRRNVIQDKLSFMVGQIEVDLIGTRGFALAEEAVEHALEATVFGRRVKIATPEYLILLKLLPLRPQDRLDIRSLVKKADRRKVRTLAKRHFLLAKLESVLKKTAPESGSVS